MDFEKRFYRSEMRVERREGGAARLVGYAAVFDSLSEDLGGFRERIAAGAFARTIQAADVRAVINHDASLILGRNTSGTLRLAEDETGLRFEVDLPDTQYARDLAVSVDRGDISGCSFMFRSVKDAWKQEKNMLPERTLQDVDLMDVGPVTYPAYPETTVFVRSKVEEMVREAEILRCAQDDNVTGEAGATPMAEVQQALERLGTLRVKLDILKRC